MALDDGAKTAADIDKFVKDYCFGFTTAHKLMEVYLSEISFSTTYNDILIRF